MTAEREQLLRAELERFVRITSTAMEPVQIILFGSLVEGNIHEWSDLDLVVIMETDLPFWKRPQAVLEHVSPHVGMDLFVYTPFEWEELVRTRPFIRQEIAGKGRVVYERAGTALVG